MYTTPVYHPIWETPHIYHPLPPYPHHISQGDPPWDTWGYPRRAGWDKI